MPNFDDFGKLRSCRPAHVSLLPNNNARNIFNARTLVLQIDNISIGYPSLRDLPLILGLHFPRRQTCFYDRKIVYNEMLSIQRNILHSYASTCYMVEVKDSSPAALLQTVYILHYAAIRERSATSRL